MREGNNKHFMSKVEHRRGHRGFMWEVEGRGMWVGMRGETARIENQLSGSMET